jgi:hypothetical protein
MEKQEGKLETNLAGRGPRRAQDFPRPVKDVSRLRIFKSFRARKFIFPSFLIFFFKLEVGVTLCLIPYDLFGGSHGFGER